MAGEPAVPPAMFQLDRATCLTLLTTQHVGRLVFGGDDTAIVPVNYVVVDGHVMFRTERASRAGCADQTPVLFEADMVDARVRSGWSVVVHGTLDALPDTARRPLLDTWAPGVHDRWMTITVETVTGRLLRNVPVPSSSSDGYL
jgi:nitroimidazol reductase NimA-like FMN-containing flavoprotein (pyridoxamine 5'-phosphate oxidase superfamily)